MANYKHLLLLSALGLLFKMGNAGRLIQPSPSVNDEQTLSQSKQLSLSEDITPGQYENKQRSPSASKDISSVIELSPSSIIKMANQNTRNNMASKIVGKDSAIVHDTKQRPRRAIHALGIFSLETIGGYIFDAAKDAIFSSVFDEDDTNIKTTLNEIISRLDDIETNLEQVSKQLWQIFLQDSHREFAPTIKITSSLLQHEAEYLSKNSRSPARREEIINHILTRDGGIELALDNLDLTITGEVLYQGKSIFEEYYDRIIQGRDLRNYIPDDKLQNKMSKFIKYHRDLRETGFVVWYAAITAKYANSMNNLTTYRAIIKNKYDRQVNNQLNVVNELFAACDLEILSSSMPNYPNRSTHIECTNGSEFGSVCTPHCSGDYLFFPIYWPSDDKFYPNYGSPPVQCLIRGHWSSNLDGQTKCFCGYNYLRICPRHLLCHAYKVSPQNLVQPGHSINHWKCVSSCVGTLHHYFCYYNSSEDWDFCVPHVVSRYYTWKTIWGEDCVSRPERDRYEWLWCYTASSWDYCS